MITRALIVNGDDFGLTPGVNRGILEAHLNGILTSTSLFANAPASDEAIRLARATPTLAVGCHLTLVDGRPTLPPSTLPTLAPGGAFRRTWGAFIRDAFSGRIAGPEIERELAAQIDRLRTAGLRLTHLDGHKHVHAYPPVFGVVSQLARRFDIRSVRVPCERRPVRLLVQHALTSDARRQAIENLALAPWAARDRRLLAREGLPPPPHFLGRALTGLLTPSSFRALLESVPAGVTELMTHPGYVDPSLAPVETRLRAEREQEVALLTSADAVDTIRSEGILLINHLRTEPRTHVA
jgi:hopanoid biosynthesis associated protein HpnK